ncbi:hypothetical protein [Paremcibacter congregatus]|uniref:Uncharacterized protein n=2 Tax=Paremcibacter congregatus TaxID=2043170 RepID=A0A2G4YRN6_9PROT|nr:hypothetical protein [Paremcibacter congregatus]PHZ84999.1 hypothetical protein CRD36_09780 [Paremcibacter congregatus]
MEHEDFSGLSKGKLKSLIKETEEVLVLLKEELQKRKLDKQHEEIDHLEDHLKEAEPHLSTIKAFIQKIIEDSKKT